MLLNSNHQADAHAHLYSSMKLFSSTLYSLRFAYMGCVSVCPSFHSICFRCFILHALVNINFYSFHLLNAVAFFFHSSIERIKRKTAKPIENIIWRITILAQVHVYHQSAQFFFLAKSWTPLTQTHTILFL